MLAGCVSKNIQLSPITATAEIKLLLLYANSAMVITLLIQMLIISKSQETCEWEYNLNMQELLWDIVNSVGWNGDYMKQSFWQFQHLSIAKDCPQTVSSRRDCSSRAGIMAQPVLPTIPPGESRHTSLLAETEAAQLPSI